MNEPHETMDGTVLSAHGLVVGVGGVRLLEGVTLDLAAGGLTGVRGPSGCGKTMLLRTLAGLIDPVSGVVRFRGRAAGVDGWPGYRRQVVLVQQQPVMLRGSIRTNLARPFEYGHVAETFSESRARVLLDRLLVGGDRLGEDARMLSVGEQQRVSLIRALLLEPSVYVLDEPTSALDPESRAQVEEVMSEEVSRRPCAVLAVTHDVSQGARWCRDAIDVGPWVVDVRRANAHGANAHGTNGAGSREPE
ncbi:MAG: ATP-binding cassette domain-containing protein [bacterium]|nr:ATP-binding cassette domain-containing protein [bacterium]